MTALRQLLSTEGQAPTKDILTKTHIMHILGKILAFETIEEEFYFLKLEALWFLVNLAACDESDDCELLLLSEYPPMNPL